MIRALLMAGLLVAACNGGAKNKPTGTGSGTGITGPCSEVADQVRQIYRGETSGNPDLDAELLEANVHMVLADCVKDPDKYVGCIRRATSITSLERDCLEPLDDEGNVEGRRFNN